jgi:hypothetical protein
VTLPEWDFRRYFVDEAGDPTLFNRGGRSVVGENGCSPYFILGAAEVDDEAGLREKLETLRASVITQPDTRSLPSVQASRRKTAEFFHAKDDHPLVRAQVFDVLSRHQIRFFALIRDKHQVLRDVAATQRLVPSYKYTPDSLYDSMVKRLFRDRLHVNGCEIVFAKRGKSDRTGALKRAIEDAKTDFQLHWNTSVKQTQDVRASTPKGHAGLEAVDYFLWALQRFLTRGDAEAWRRISHRAVEIVSMEEGLAAERTFTPSKPLIS